MQTREALVKRLRPGSLIVETWALDSVYLQSLEKQALDNLMDALKRLDEVGGSLTEMGPCGLHIALADETLGWVYSWDKDCLYTHLDYLCRMRDLTRTINDFADKVVL